jgi:hypothetical protein
LIINSSFELYFIQSFWVLLFTVYSYFCVNITFYQMTFLYHLPVFEVKTKKC